MTKDNLVAYRAKVAEHPILSLSATETLVQSSSRYFDPVLGQAFEKFLSGVDRLPGEAWIQNTTYLAGPAYLFLRAKIRRLKSQRKPLLIKINSHPCAGKSYFIECNAKNFEGTANCSTLTIL